MKDPLLADALALVKALGRDNDGFAEVLNTTDCVEHHKLILRLAALVDLAVKAPDWDRLEAAVAVMQGSGEQP